MGKRGMKGLFVTLPLALVLAGCFSDQKQQLAQCELDAQLAHQKLSEPENLQYEYISMCMAAHGYEDNIRNKKCGHLPNIFEDFWRNPYCYAPTTIFGKWVFRLETSEEDE